MIASTKGAATSGNGASKNKKVSTPVINGSGVVTPSKSAVKPGTPSSATSDIDAAITTLRVKVTFDAAQPADSQGKIYLNSKDFRKLNVKIGSYMMFESCDPPLVLACWPSKSLAPGHVQTHSMWKDALKLDGRGSDCLHTIRSNLPKLVRVNLPVVLSG
jgi:hypothetical protein